MKKLLIFVLLFLIFPLNATAISAESYIVMDMNTNRVLGGNNIHQKKLIASISKIMTCYLAVKYGDLDEKVVVGDEVLKAYGSAIYIEIGEELTLKDLLYGLMLRSGNDAALVIAKSVSGNIDNFVKLMNATALEIGMKDTNFLNPHGLEENNGAGNISTSYDMALLTSLAMKNKNYQEIVKAKSYKATSNYKSYVWKNKNKLLSLYEYTTGGKTGFTEKARRTLVTTADNGNRKLVIVTLNDGNDFQDHIDLYQNYYTKYNNERVLDKSTFISNDTLYNDYSLIIKNNYEILVTKDELKNIKLVEKIIKNKFLKNNREIGKVEVYLEDKLLHEESIIAVKKKEKKDNFFIRIWRKIKLWWE